MSAPDRDSLAVILARAFDRAWEAYYVLGQGPAILQDVARPALAQQLVTVAKTGIEDEDALAAAGLRHLLSLSPALHFTTHDVRATLIQQRRVRLRPLTGRH
jgi:hypothetical protein